MITIVFDGNYYKVSGELPSTIHWERIAGYIKYDNGKVKQHWIPAVKKRDLWAMLNIHAYGCEVDGPKGKFTIGELTDAKTISKVRNRSR